MTFRSEGDDPNDAFPSQSLAEETTVTKRRQLTITTTTPPLLPTLPFDLVPEILCRLPVKLLLQLRCICKSWKSLISDPKFAKKHLRMSKASQHNHHLIVSTMSDNSCNLLLWDSPISSTLSTSSVTQTQLRFPDSLNIDIFIFDVCSCDGILCFTIKQCFPLLWNPSIRRFNMFPLLDNPALRYLYSFGYDQFTHTYKIVAISSFKDNTKAISIYTLGTNSWRRIEDLPCSGSIIRPGVFMSGTINWLVYYALSSLSHSYVFVSLDLEKESYQKLLLPNAEKGCWILGVLRDCLCFFSTNNMLADVWIMKEYGNKKPWTKLYKFSYMEYWGFYSYAKALYITEDEQAIMYFKEVRNLKFVVYDSKNGTFNMPRFQNIEGWMHPDVYVESLISPCF